MRRFLSTAAVAALAAAGLALGSGVAAHADVCSGSSPGVNQNGSGAQVCTAAGTLTASGDTSPSGYVEADGNGSPAPCPLGGYIGVAGNSGGVTVYGSSSSSTGNGPSGSDTIVSTNGGGNGPTAPCGL